MCELFTINGLCYAREDIDNEDCIGIGSTYFCCGKVSICRNGRSIIAYILNESTLFWIVHLTTDEIVTVPKKKYNHELKYYKYLVGTNEMRVEDYDPIRIKLHSSGKVTFILNRVLVDNNNKLIIHRKR